MFSTMKTVSTFVVASFDRFDVMLDDSEVERVLVITAHPDDVDFGAAGTIARWTDSGIEVVYCIVTDGDAGGFDPNVARSEIAGIRQREQTQAAKEVGVERLYFLGFPDGRLEANLELRKAISRTIRQVRPQRVVIQSPERNYQRIYASHPDHLACGEAALCAVYPDSRNPYTFTELISEEGLDAWSVGEVWMMAGSTPDHASDITEQVERKIRALLAHESQHTDPQRTEQMVRGWVTDTAVRMNLPEGRAAEAFQIINTA
jgi:LmbE family N-acetylglucosaminyl deacetylase